MSSLLEQAIVDAQALRNAALKNAEQLVIEKYSDQVKQAVSSLLEQEEFDFSGMPGAEDAEMASDPTTGALGADTTTESD